MTDCFESKTLNLSVQPMDVSARGNLAAVATIDGCISLAKLDAVEANSDAASSSAAVQTWEAHKRSCRTTLFLGSSIVSGDSQGNIHVSDIETCRLESGIRFVDSEEEEEPSGGEDEEGEEVDCGASCMLRLDDANVFAVGYDDGVIRIFDKRCLTKDTAELCVHTDFVSDMDLSASGNQFVTASGDGTLALFDIRKNKKIARSEDDADDEMLSVLTMKAGKKVVCGHQSGILGIYSWGYWNDCSDRFPGHPGSVDTIVKVDEDTLLTGSSDGLIRVVSILPNKALGIVGEHLADYPVEKLCLEPETKTLLSISHNNTVKVWSVGELFESDDESEDGKGADSDDSESDSEEEEKPSSSRKRQKKSNQKGKGKNQAFQSSKQAQRSAFFADM
jgi:WD40 repeat protein